MEEEESAEHAVAFGLVRSRVVAWDRAGSSSYSFVTGCYHPASGALKMISCTVANDSGRSGAGEPLKKFNWSTSAEVSSL
jgi:hypothetical protein